MDVLEKDEFLKAYRSISTQLKKKFVGFRQEVKRPNVIDAVDGFGENLCFFPIFKFANKILII
jgi:hypothetical protein